MALTKRQIIVIAVIVASVAGYFILDRVIVTAKERVEAAVETLRDSVARGDARAFAACISSAYYDETLSAAQLIAAASKFFESHGALEVTVQGMRVTVAGASAAARVSATVRGEHGYWGRTEWQVDFQKERNGDWRVVRLSPLRLGAKDVNGWGDVLRAGRL